jgi:hypothetical protein
MALAALMLAPVAEAAASAPPAAGCTSPRYREFDFFVGRWNVYDRNGRRVGTDVVEKRLKGCVVYEQFTDTGGSVGIGLSGLQPATGQWYQDFMGDDGLLVTLRGRPANGAAMVLRGEDYLHGSHWLDRGVWTVRGAGVEELWTGSTDGGKTWQTVFDGFFRRQPRASMLRANGGHAPASSVVG